MALFIYGTLLDPVMLARIAGGDIPEGKPATLVDHRVLRQNDEPFPYLTKSAGHVASGILFDSLSENQSRRLDAYEIPFGYFREAVTLSVQGELVAGFAYFPDPSVQATDQDWDMAEWEDKWAPFSREMAVEIGSYDPPLDGDALAQQWAMIGRRASARLAAGRDHAPSRLRYAAKPDDVTLLNRGPLTGNFFKMGAFELTHRTFSGEQSDTLAREVFEGTDASLVLPYDPQSDNVLLVEQIRMGPLIRGSRNPWSLEPIAGMIDASEAPETAGLREAKEEADLADITLRKMFAVYASPGSTTDYFHCYLGICALPSRRSYRGGLDEEGEDLRLHIIPFDEAIALLETGEINAAPLVSMLLWLHRYRTETHAGS